MEIKGTETNECTVEVSDEDMLSALMEECYEQNMVKDIHGRKVYIDDEGTLYLFINDHRNDPIRHDLPKSQQTKDNRGLVRAFKIIHEVLGVKY